MREGREIAARPDRAPGRDVRTMPAFRTARSSSTVSTRAPGVPLRNRVRPQHHRSANDLVGVGRPDAARMAAKQTELELLRLIVRDRLGDEPTEPGIDAICVLAAQVVEEPPGATHSVDGARREGDLRSIATCQTSSTVRSSPVRRSGVTEGESIRTDRDDTSAITGSRRNGSALVRDPLDPRPRRGVSREGNEERIPLDRNQPSVSDSRDGRCPRDVVEEGELAEPLAAFECVQPTFRHGAPRRCHPRSRSIDRRHLLHG